MNTDYDERYKKLVALTNWHERIRNAMLGESLEAKRPMAELLHKVENEMRKLRGLKTIPWVPTPEDMEDD